MENEVVTIAQMGEWFVQPLAVQGAIALGVLNALFTHSDVVPKEPAQSVSEFFAFNLSFILQAAFIGATNFALNWAIGITQFEMLKAVLQLILFVNFMYLSLNSCLVGCSVLKALNAFRRRVHQSKAI
jgi:hypothetical protein